MSSRIRCWLWSRTTRLSSPSRTRSTTRHAAVPVARVARSFSPPPPPHHPLPPGRALTRLARRAQDAAAWSAMVTKAPRSLLIMGGAVLGADRASMLSALEKVPCEAVVCGAVLCGRH
jgi:hypothetical protein